MGIYSIIYIYIYIHVVPNVTYVQYIYIYIYIYYTYIQIHVIPIGFTSTLTRIGPQRLRIRSLTRQVPSKLRGKQLYSLDLGQLVAGGLGMPMPWPKNAENVRHIHIETLFFGQPKGVSWPKISPVDPIDSEHVRSLCFWQLSPLKRY